jgi:anionic cell wall polymer biosynthesis LytR-Cps2A-Psr (LCP) family protein
VRIPSAFASLDEVLRPPEEPGQTFLMVGEDSRSAAGPSDAALMVAEIAEDRGGVAVVSVPGRAAVDVPGRGRVPVGGVHAAGGDPAPVVGAIETLTGTRIDHVAVVDFARFDAVVDAIGGVDLPGATGLTGAETVAYLDGPDTSSATGAPDRTGRQETVLRAVLGKVISSGTLTDPVAAFGLLDAIGRSVRLDDGLTNGGLRSLAFELRGLRPADFTLLEAPVAGPAGQDGPTALDAGRAPELWEALRTGRAAEYAERHPEDLFGAVPS